MTSQEHSERFFYDDIHSEPRSVGGQTNISTHFLFHTFIHKFPSNELKRDDIISPQTADLAHPPSHWRVRLTIIQQSFQHRADEADRCGSTVRDHEVGVRCSVREELFFRGLLLLLLLRWLETPPWEESWLDVKLHQGLSEALMWSVGTTSSTHASPLLLPCRLWLVGSCQLLCAPTHLTFQDYTSL